VARNAKSGFSQRVIEIIRKIPEGRVTTYGQIAVMAGNRFAARQVVRILHSCSGKETLSWHRVINSKGTISLGGEGYKMQRRLLEAEGIIFDEAGRIDFDRFLWKDNL